MTIMLSSSSTLALNAGSSSIRFALYQGDPFARVCSGKIDRIGMEGSVFLFAEEGSAAEAPLLVDAPDHTAAVAVLFQALEARFDLSQLVAVGHRVVHGVAHDAHVRVTDEVLAGLRDSVSFAPEHLPQEIALMEAFRERYPTVPQVACFDTVFHHTLPPSAYTLPIPSRFSAKGFRRYGFHGLSYEYLAEQLRALPGDPSQGRVILAHLGNGASMAALRGGKSVDTSMGFTPLGGLPMGTRTGDLDPGVVLAIMQAEGFSPQEMSRVLNHESGLLGISETSPHMLDLLEREGEDPRAHLAIDVFCAEAKKQIGAYAAVLGGLDTLVFSGGMGEQSAPIRARICDGLSFLGVTIDEHANDVHASVISLPDSTVTVRVIPTNEELMIAKTARRFSDIL